MVSKHLALIMSSSGVIKGLKRKLHADVLTILWFLFIWSLVSQVLATVVALHSVFFSPQPNKTVAKPRLQLSGCYGLRPKLANSRRQNKQQI